MKYLKIEENKGYYWDGTRYQEIDKINKDSLLALINKAEEDEFEMDDYDETLLGNKAHQVIYENIFSKFQQFLNEKDQFKAEVDRLYSEAINKYGVESNNFKNNDDNVEYVDGEDDEGSNGIPF